MMVGDNDAGGIATYTQAGQNYGTSLLWALLILIPVLIVNQEMVVRLGAVTGVGHARLIFECFGKVWCAFSVGDLFVLNYLTIACATPTRTAAQIQRQGAYSVAPGRIADQTASERAR
jgi:Mn2+/Fe2+ NRAMP family transporter